MLKGRLRLGLRRVAERKPRRAEQLAERQRRIQAYIDRGRVPWSDGYKQYRSDLLHSLVQDEDTLARFREGAPLPDGFGLGVDERVIEYPWAIGHLPTAPGRLLDAGSTLNKAYLLDLPQLATKTIVITTLAPEEHLERRANVSYLFGDLRDLILRDAVFHTVVCISTLDHVGLDNTRLYTPDERFRERQADDYRRVLAELRRVLVPGGRLLLTVPYGRAETVGWMQQFDRAGLDAIAEAFGAAPAATTFFRYLPGGWVLSDAVACANCTYYDVHSAAGPAPDGAAAARAVACLEFVRPSDS